MNAALLKGVSKNFGAHRAVDDVSLAVPSGSVYGFIGPNGSGKTTTIRILLHILEPDSGVVEVLGERSTRAANDRVGYLPEERGLYKKMTVGRVLRYYASLKGMGKGPAKAAIDDWLERLGLSDWRDKKVETLSKGMAQKVQFISTVVSGPELVILDEPFTGLDPVNLDVLRDAILALRDAGSTVIFSTHDMAMAEKMCDSIFMIYRGRKVLDGTLDSIQAEYGADTVRVRVEGGADVVEEVLRGSGRAPRVTDFGNLQEVHEVEDAQALLAALSARTSVQLFEIARPSLHDIFVRIAGPEAGEARMNVASSETGGIGAGAVARV
jgi:ABC-2 type transport system ATP-binding protein